VSEPLNPQSDGVGFLIAIAIGFLLGRTRERGAGETPKPGIRDFVIIALLGGVCARIDSIAITVALAAAMTGVLLVTRFQHPERTGVTTELAAVTTFLLGYLCLTPLRPLGAALGIILAGALAAKEELHQFALRTISQREFGDTLKFLALIFVIYPLLPSGAYGPFQFFEPRRIWIFVILVSGVSYVGYFLTKFLKPGKGELLTAVVGGLASTTAYTGGVAKAVAESPGSAVPLARAALLANSIQPPRLLLLAAITAPPLAWRALPAFVAMTVAGLFAAWILGRSGTATRTTKATATFKNPFALGPALKFGVVFTVVLFLTRAGREYLGDRGQFITSALGGILDVDAVLLSVANVFKDDQAVTRDTILAVILAVATNAMFKSALGFSSHQPAFYLRLIAGFLIMIGAGLLVVFTVGISP
jgi:uncharacterized membrane protein (DUF4010 family)